MSNISLNSMAAQEEAVARQRRKTTLASIGISLLVVALLMLVLALVLLPSLQKEPPVVVAYSAPTKEQDQVQKKTRTKVTSKPAAPSSSQAQVIAAASAAPVAVPVPEVAVSDVSLEFGSGDDFGAGWETGDSADGMGGTTSFFKQEVKAQRIAYVIDYSKSMGNKKSALAKEELTDSIKKLKPGMQYQMVFFSGPAWVAGSEVDVRWEQGEATIIGLDEEVYEWEGKGHNLLPKGKEQPVEWIEYSAKNRRDSVDHIEETPLSLGTNWVPPLEMVFDMKPRPQIVFFMTDGTGGGNTMQVAEEMAKQARRRKIIVNTVALMDPNAEEAMSYIAEETGGQFTIVDQDGKAKVQNFGEDSEDDD